MDQWSEIDLKKSYLSFLLISYTVKIKYWLRCYDRFYEDAINSKSPVYIQQFIWLKIKHSYQASQMKAR